jgi:hypothetical protein
VLGANVRQRTYYCKSVRPNAVMTPVPACIFKLSKLLP